MNGKKAKAIRRLAGNPGRGYGAMERNREGSIVHVSGSYRPNYQGSKARLGHPGDGRAVMLWRGMRSLPDVAKKQQNKP